MSLAMRIKQNELVDSSFETITPADAKRILAKSQFKNRPLSSRYVDELASQMAAGYWKINGESIKFDKFGNVFDGQHRLHAIIKSQVTIITNVARNLDSSVFDTIDGGRKRTDANNLSVAGEKNSSTLAAALKTVAAFDNIGYLAFSTGASTREKYTAKIKPVKELIKDYQGIRYSVDYVCGIGNSRIFRPVSFASSAHYIFGRHDSMRRDWFFDSLHRNHFTSATCPARALYMTYQSEKTLLKMKTSRRYQAALWFKSFAAYCNGDPITQLRIQDNEKFPTLPQTV